MKWTYCNVENKYCNFCINKRFWYWFFSWTAWFCKKLKKDTVDVVECPIKE